MYRVLREIGTDDVEAGMKLYVDLGEHEADDAQSAGLKAASGVGGDYVGVARKSWRILPRLAFRQETKAVWGAEDDAQTTLDEEASQEGKDTADAEEASGDPLAGAEVVDAREPVEEA